MLDTLRLGRGRERGREREREGEREGERRGMKEREREEEGLTQLVNNWLSFHGYTMETRYAFTNYFTATFTSHGTPNTTLLPPPPPSSPLLNSPQHINTHIAGIVLEKLKVFTAGLAVVNYVFVQHQQKVVHDAGHWAAVGTVTERKEALNGH